ncbi:ABC transporter ATP-binding protein [Alteribacter populi]|uniref:ABC transporter ATP-binding protein n=1 Tax=Alteribacter populi TaxID=2011011 RepID=UPI000BBB0168|nr:ABC transporter ATP-binding protein [Alteribacter populi]
MQNTDKILEVKNLNVHFHSSSSIVRAVNGVSFDLNCGESLAIVGESGSGKSVTATSILGLLPKQTAKIDEGQIIYKNKDLTKKSNRYMRKIRGNEISIIFQDPMSSLNPVFTIGNQIIEVLRLHQRMSKKQAKKKAVKMLQLVGIPEAEKRIDEYPHEFSGGMRQRVMIAMALSCEPNLLIADEPTTALDVTVQAQILKLMKDLQNQFNTSIILITHDLGVVWESCEKVLVMYAGNAVEYTSAKRLHEQPLHPYTWGLLDSRISANHEKQKKLQPIEGSPPDLNKDLKGCPFAQRCNYANGICIEVKPPLVEVEEGHQVACHFQQKDQRLVREGDYL